MVRGKNNEKNQMELKRNQIKRREKKKMMEKKENHNKIIENLIKQERTRYKFYFDWTDKTSGIFLGIKEIIASKQTDYQFVEIIDFEDVGFSLVIDGKIQVAEVDEFVYHEVLVHIPMVTFGEPQKVLVIGGGDGCALREIFKWKSVRRCVLVDLDREVVEMAKEYLSRMNESSFFDPRLELVFDDGRKYLENSNEKFDVIIIDTVDPLEYGPAYLLFTKEFMEVVKDKLSDGGIVSIQSNAVFPGGSQFLLAMYKTLERVFPKVSFASAYVKSFFLNWAFTFGCKDRAPEDLTREEIAGKISQIKTRYLTEDVFIASLAKPKYFMEDLKRFNQIITDDNPVFVR